MKTFLQEIAQDIIRNYPGKLGDITIIFPNRRAGLFFREYLKQELNGPSWSPQVLSFQDFIAASCPLQKADQLFLVHQLHTIYNQQLKTREGFDRFYYWGQMLLKDFDDVDKYLVNAQNLYTNLSRQKQLDLSFDFLLPEQKEIIQRFWQGFDESKSAQKERFEFVWSHLFQVYRSFNQQLSDKGLAYEGMQYRYMAEHLEEIPFKKNNRVVFAGFNALNAVEDKIISWCLENLQADILWDMDAYYFNNEHQEAGTFLRQYHKRQVYAPSFPETIPSSLTEVSKELVLTGVPQHVGQAKILGQKLGALLKEHPDLDIRKVAVVLADEALLFPVLHSLPEEIEAVNVTMGFPLSYAPVNSLIEHILELRRMARKDPDGLVLFHFKPALAIIRHPLIIQTDVDKLEEWANDVQRSNKVFFTTSELPEHALIKMIFSQDLGDLVDYLSAILLELNALADPEKNTIEVEYVHQYYQLLNRYADLLRNSDTTIELKPFAALFKQLVRTERLPFTGEPLRGLQIMGVLETRNLDFEHIFVLSMNEDFFPSQGGKHSFIPYNLRKAYELPNYDQQDAIYAYLFYRLIQRASSVNFFYNTEGNDLGGGEMSRFLQQLLHESNLPIKVETLANYTEPGSEQVITVNKDDDVLKSLSRYLNTGQRIQKRLSPSALNTYLDCRLRFYFRHVADLYEKSAMEEDVDARSLGNVLHHAMEILYEDYLKDKTSRTLVKADFKELKTKLESAAVFAFRKQFSIAPDRKFYFEGKNIIAKEIIKDFMQAILKLDEQYAPFEIVGMESEHVYDLTMPEMETAYLDAYKIPGESTMSVALRGTIDRIDRKKGQVRLIDYKTGQDKHVFNSIEELFDRKKKNKAALQTFIYALLYQNVKDEGEALVPAVFNKDALFMGDDVLLEYKGQGKVTNAAYYLEPYTEQLQLLLKEIFDPETPFDQTDEVRKCTTCAYKGICGR
ncbi:PD-(D/E)XK nuclease family protein [Fulvivirga sp. M361]|uniref:PD-(D/E)XK nuclease family protein n=1 Tax=Fulvivirga sp. M361 TaxID=2594266 RepID=UPI001179E50B|nr:PD-(D/E)XK nuclease family protein [Fulvivirga sp. M361]TRX47148.1 PD-(D/E)XK nuclease family protein [Fulvivirga sp. M361]